MIREFTDANFKSEVLETDGLVIVDFWATWCRPCHALAPLIDKLGEDYPGVKVGKVNIDENQEVTGKNKISAIPSVLVFKNGKVVERFVGMQKENTLTEAIARNL